MTILQQTDLLRIKANSYLDPKKKSALGQFYTSAPICLFMASLFHSIDGVIKLLDPGCGPGSLSAAFVDESVYRNEAKSIDLTVYDIEKTIEPFIAETLNSCVEFAKTAGIAISGQFHLKDFILNNSNNFGLFSKNYDYTHVIMNPPYKKISTKSSYRKALINFHIKTVNLYAGFVALAIKQLRRKGELVAIIPRSFCNGPYYQPFRKILLSETAIQHIHIFDSRKNAFSDDDVLQENIIIHLIKGVPQEKVTITSSPNADFHFDKQSKTVSATDMTTRMVAFNEVVVSDDKQKFIHIASNERDQQIINRLSCFNTSLDGLSLMVSTGPVVDYRLKDDLRKDLEDGAVPLIYPIHLKGGLQWPIESKKPNAIAVSDKSEKWLWQHSGNFVIVRRFSSKEEKRRITARFYDSSLPGKLIGFDNKLNVFHAHKKGFDRDIALGLYVYLNSTLLDKVYRIFGGHTQVNATDLKTINYPDLRSLARMGKEVDSENLEQNQIDEILEREIIRMSGDTENPLEAQNKIDQALEIIVASGMPRAQQNERSALTLLALLDLHPQGSWKKIKRPLIGVTPIMDWCRNIYGQRSGKIQNITSIYLKLYSIMLLI